MVACKHRVGGMTPTSDDLLGWPRPAGWNVIEGPDGVRGEWGICQPDGKPVEEFGMEKSGLDGEPRMPVQPLNPHSAPEKQA